MEYIESILNEINAVVWGVPMLVLLFGTHVFLTFRLKLIQRYIWTGIKISVSRTKEGSGDVSQFGALTTALAATIGTGNIVGVSTAIAAGGPGAVFWMWLTGVFGIATKYSEALLAVKYRTIKEDGSYAGGPMYVLEKGLNMKWLGIVFAALTAVTAFGIGNMVQANSISQLALTSFEIPTYVTGIFLAVLTGFVIIGGIKSIAKWCEKLVPFMAVFYVIGCFILLAMNFQEIPHAFGLIFEGAFSGTAITGGFMGATMKEAIKMGVSRGLFSNESGLGSAPIVAAAAQTKNPVRQALVSSTGTFWDTVVICLITGVVIVNSGEWQTGLRGAELTHAAFEEMPVIGSIILTVGLLTFVFSTIIGWSYYGEKAIEYLAGKKAIKPYRILWVIFVLIGSLLSLPVVWTFADITNALMAIPNLTALLLLSGVLVAETKKYLWEGKIDDI